MSKMIAIIPARKGSKGVPGKNTKLIAGKPLISYTIEAALEVFESHQICVTTDDQQVIDIARSHDIIVPFVRPEELSSDKSSMDEVLRHALANFDENPSYDAFVLLQPTSIFRRSSHIYGALNIFSHQIDMVVSVKKTKSNPYYVLFEENERGFLEKSKKGNFATRQECPEVWEYNGAVYVINMKSFKDQKIHEFTRVKKYVMSEEDSVDIDTPYDWKLAELMMKDRKLA